METVENLPEQEQSAETKPSQPTIISSSDLQVLREAGLRASVAFKEAQLAESQKENLTLRIYLKYHLTPDAQISDSGEVFYPKEK